MINKKLIQKTEQWKQSALHTKAFPSPYNIWEPYTLNLLSTVISRHYRLILPAVYPAARLVLQAVHRYSEVVDGFDEGA